MRNIIYVLEAEFTLKDIVEIRMFNIALCDTEHAHNLQRCKVASFSLSLSNT